jgi:hypothetical protein
MITSTDIPQSSERFSNYYNEYKNSGAYAEFFGYPYAPISSILVYDPKFAR